MTKLYGKTSSRATKAVARGLLIVAIALPMVMAPCLSKSARAADMMLLEEQKPFSHGYGWLFIGLTLVSYGVAANDYEESQYNLKKAKDAYRNYQHATTADQALAFRNQTITFGHRAEAYESTTNAALIVGSVLALTAIAIFRSEGVDNSPILLSDRGIAFHMNF